MSFGVRLSPPSAAAASPSATGPLGPRPHRRAGSPGGRGGLGSFYLFSLARGSPFSCRGRAGREVQRHWGGGRGVLRALPPPPSLPLSSQPPSPPLWCPCFAPYRPAGRGCGWGRQTGRWIPRRCCRLLLPINVHCWVGRVWLLKRSGRTHYRGHGLGPLVAVSPSPAPLVFEARTATTRCGSCPLPQPTPRCSPNPTQAGGPPAQAAHPWGAAVTLGDGVPSGAAHVCVLSPPCGRHHARPAWFRSARAALWIGAGIGMKRGGGGGSRSLCDGASRGMTVVRRRGGMTRGGGRMGAEEGVMEGGGRFTASWAGRGADALAGSPMTGVVAAGTRRRGGQEDGTRPS